MATVWALVVGVNNYLSPDLKNLTNAVEHSKTFATVIQKYCLFDDLNLVHLYDGAESDEAKPTSTNFDLRLQAVVKLAQPGDLFVLYFAGHSRYQIEKPGETAKFVRMFHDSPATGPMTRGLTSDSDISNYLSTVICNKLIIFDTCYPPIGENVANSYVARGKSPDELITDFNIPYVQLRKCVVLCSCQPWHETLDNSPLVSYIEKILSSSDVDTLVGDSVEVSSLEMVSRLIAEYESSAATPGNPFHYFTPSIQMNCDTGKAEADFPIARLRRREKLLLAKVRDACILGLKKGGLFPNGVPADLLSAVSKVNSGVSMSVAEKIAIDEFDVIVYLSKADVIKLDTSLTVLPDMSSQALTKRMDEHLRDLASSQKSLLKKDKQKFMGLCCLVALLAVVLGGFFFYHQKSMSEAHAVKRAFQPTFSQLGSNKPYYIEVNGLGLQNIMIGQDVNEKTDGAIYEFFNSKITCRAAAAAMVRAATVENVVEDNNQCIVTETYHFENDNEAYLNYFKKLINLQIITPNSQNVQEQWDRFKQPTNYVTKATMGEWLINFRKRHLTVLDRPSRVIDALNTPEKRWKYLYEHRVITSRWAAMGNDELTHGEFGGWLYRFLCSESTNNQEFYGWWNKLTDYDAPVAFSD